MLKMDRAGKISRILICYTYYISKHWTRAEVFMRSDKKALHVINNHKGSPLQPRMQAEEFEH